MKKNAIIFGTGLIYSIVKQALFDQFNIVAIFDNNHTKWNTTIDGVTICNPAIVGGLQYDVIVIAASHSIEIAKQLRSLGVPVSKMEIGANYVFQRMFDADDISIRYILENDCSLACKINKSRASLIDVNIFQDKTVLLDPLGIPALIALFENRNHLPDFFRLSEAHCGHQKGIFLDIGANIGTTSIQATEFSNVDAVISLEPSRDAYALLRANIYINKLENKITAFRYAVGDMQATN